MRFMDNETIRNTADVPHIKDIKFGHGTLFVGTQGWVAVTRGGWQVFPTELYYAAKEPGQRLLTVSTDHQRNFVDCVLSREQPVSDLTSAVQSDMICHLSDISIRTGRAITWDPQQETIVDDAEAARMIRREMRQPWTL
jgi:hypothetical protein